MKKKSNWIIGGIFAAVGVVMMIIAWTLFKNDQKFAEEAASAMGTVVESVYVKSRKGKVTYYPVVEFQTVEGKRITFRSNTGSRPPIYEDGEQVSVLYEKQNPANAKIAGFWELWGISVILGVLGVVFLLIGSVIALK